MLSLSIRIILKSLVSCSFLVLLRYSFKVFSFISTCLCLLPIFSWLGSSIPFVSYRCPFLIICMAYFLCQILFLYYNSVFLLPVLGFPILFHFWQTVQCCPCTVVDWFFSCDLVSLSLPLHFISVWLSDIIVITNSNCDKASPWKIPLVIFTLAKIFLLSILLSSFSWFSW